MDSRKAAMVAFSVIALLAAAGVIYWTIKSQQPQVVMTIDGGTGTNPKVLFMKAQKEKAAGGGAEKDPMGQGGTPEKEPAAQGGTPDKQPTAQEGAPEKQPTGQGGTRQ
jgi:hypothetical protein